MSHDLGYAFGLLFFAAGIGEEFHDILIKFWCFKWNLLTLFTPFIIVLVSFLSFVIWNGSIVLGMVFLAIGFV